MTKSTPAIQPENAPIPVSQTLPPQKRTVLRILASGFKLRHEIPNWLAIVLGLSCCLIVFLMWWFVTRGGDTDRIVSRLSLPSPRETFAALPDLWSTEVTVKTEIPKDFAEAASDISAAPGGQSERQLVLLPNIVATLRRVALGFLLAMVIGVPTGILAGCFSPVNAFLAPVVTFGRNIPLAAMVGLLFLILGTGELYKIMFIFTACVAFIISDTARAIHDVAGRYVDTAYTLGAKTSQVIFKVLVPLAMPTIFSSGRLLFGIAFGYIMLAESTRTTESAAGLGYQIALFQRRASPEAYYMIVLIIPIVAFLVDRLLVLTQRQLFPHIYGGPGYLQRMLRWCRERWEYLMPFFFESHWPQRSKSAANPPPGSSK